MGVLMLVELFINIAGINLVAILNQVSVWWHIAIVAAVVVLVFLAGKPDAVGSDPLRDPAAGRGRQLAERPRPGHTGLRAGDHLPGDPGLLLLAPPGELDVHRL